MADQTVSRRHASAAARRLSIWLRAAGSPNVVFGVNGALLGDVIGIDVDFGHAPGFFQSGDQELVRGSSVTTLTGNVVIALPRRLTEYMLGPYFVVGAGLMHARIDDVVRRAAGREHAAGDGRRGRGQWLSVGSDRSELGSTVLPERRREAIARIQHRPASRAALVLAREHGARDSVMTRSIR